MSIIYFKQIDKQNNLWLGLKQWYRQNRLLLGGPKAKKFMYKKLAELFKHIHSLPMNEQKELISTSFNEWKGHLEQVDDVCVIGVRI